MDPRPSRRTCLFSLAAAPMTRLLGQNTRPNIVLLIGDNWAWPHASAYGDAVVRTPTFDRIAREGVLFRNAFAPNPSCSPSRSSLLTGQSTHRLGSAASLYGPLERRHAIYPDLLKAAGYAIGLSGKGWAPGSVPASGRSENHAGKPYASFAEFLSSVPKGAPFCYWLGAQSPHVPWDQNQQAKASMDPAKVAVPAHLPDHATVRDDILSYYCEVQDFDRQAAEVLAVLEKQGLLDNTLVVMTSDNGWQMPRGLANVYGLGTHIPLAMRWGKRIKPGTKVDAFVGIEDLAPTFLEAAGLEPQPAMTARSLFPLTEGKPQPDRDCVFLERERHANVRRGDLSYPIRAIRTKDFLYIRNLRPDRWPAGDPELYWAVGPYGDIDYTPTKGLLQEKRQTYAKSFALCFEKRPAEELFDLRKDPWETRNLAGDPAYAADKQRLAARLEQWRKKTADPRAIHDSDDWDKMPYSGPKARATKK